MYNFKKGDTVFYIDDRYANNVDNIQEGIVFKVEDTHNNCWSDAGTKVYLSELSYDYVYLNKCFINKEEVIKQTEAENQSNQTEPTAPDTKKNVSPIITYWGQESPGTDFEANGRVAGVIESDGTCTLTLTKGGKSVSTKRTALANAQDTTCGLMTIKFSSLTAGDWKAVLSYSSSKSQGSSSAIVVKVE